MFYVYVGGVAVAAVYFYHLHVASIKSYIATEIALAVAAVKADLKKL